MADSKRAAKIKRISDEADKRLERVEATYEADRKSGRSFNLNAGQIYAILAGLGKTPNQDEAIEIVNAVERDPHLYLTTGTCCYNFGRIQCIALGHHNGEDE